MRSHRRTLAALLVVAVAPGIAVAQTPPGMEGLLLSSPPPAAAPQAAPAGPASPGLPPNVGAPQAAPAVTPAGKSRRDAAFENAIRQVNPLTPGQIKQYRSEESSVRRALVSPVNPGRPVSRAVRVTLKPGEQPPVVRAQPGMVSTLTFSDVTGQPWPVLSVVVGNPSAYVAQSAGEEGKTNIIVLSATAEHIPSNIAVTLLGHPVPILMAVEQGSPETDFRVDVRVDSRGPNAAQDIVGVSSLAPTNDSNMIKFLDGQAPQGARRLSTSSSDVEAWRHEDILYVRTRGELLSPAYTARSNNVAGVNVFVMADSPVVLVSSGGRTQQVIIRR